MEGFEGVTTGDMVIVLLGPTGAGKSTFINAVLGDARAGVNSGYDAGTTELQHYILGQDAAQQLHPHITNHRVVLLDTPGFQNIYSEDVRILIQISNWLASCEGVMVLGIVYIFPIFPVKMTIHERHNLELLPSLFGEGPSSRIYPVTSRWDICPPNIGMLRERELTDKYWKSLLRGSSPHRFMDQASAKSIVASMIECHITSSHSSIHSRPLGIQQVTINGKPWPHFIAQLLAKQKRRHDPSTRQLILVLGDTGAGKSSFINDLAGEERANVNASITAIPSIDYYDIPSADGTSTITFVDCPGYNSTEMKDREISSMIRNFLANSPSLFSSKSKIIGVICLINMSQHFNSSPLGWQHIFTSSKLDCPKLLAVTHPGNEAQTQAARGGLEKLPVIRKMISNGAHIAHYQYGTSGYAWPLVQYITGRNSSLTLRTFLKHVLRS